MYESEQAWRAVDSYLVDALVDEDDALRRARESSRAEGLAPAEVSPNQGRFLALLCEMVGAQRVLEFGTLGGYSTIWFARAVGPAGRVTTLEIDEHSAAVARANLARAQVADRVDVIVGPAAESVRRLITTGEDPYDLVFIDADKPNNPVYLAAALDLARPGTVIVADNVVRNGAVTDPDSADDGVRGTRALIEMMRTDPRLAATALQTVGSKGWDGFCLARVRSR
jgi:predicted O-methyltransferase YrrM